VQLEHVMDRGELRTEQQAHAQLREQVRATATEHANEIAALKSKIDRCEMDVRGMKSANANMKQHLESQRIAHVQRNETLIMPPTRSASADAHAR
jgi:SMC interacting uncharacterized protein involved in chromosome segregation